MTSWMRARAAAGSAWAGGSWRAGAGLSVLALLLFAGLARGQAEQVSDTEVIGVAQRMYCPVCENIPLDECQTGACLEWKEEIRAQLGAGRSEQEIISSFVARFGDHVVGVPQDPLLRMLTVALPLLGLALAIGLAGRTFRRFGRARELSLAHEPAGTGAAADAVYRRRLEADLRARR